MLIELAFLDNCRQKSVENKAELIIPLDSFRPYLPIQSKFRAESHFRLRDRGRPLAKVY